MSELTPAELDRLADAIADRLAARMGSPSHETMLTPREAAKVLGVSVSTLERRTAAGDVASIKLGRLRRYRMADLVGGGEQ